MNNSNQKKEKNQPISVYVRVRPMNKQETHAINSNVIDIRGKELTVRNNHTEKYHRSFAFDKVFGPESKQIDVFKTIAEPAVAEIISGYNCTIFAYGQTGTGKTYTMAGGNETSITEFTSWKEEEHAGIIPRTLSYLFDELRVQQIEYTVRVSYLELYNEEIFDLLSPPEDTSKLKLFDDVNRKGSVIVQGLAEVSVSSKGEVYKILESGAEKRRTATTLMNAQSSRSHTIFSVTVHTKESSVDGEDLLKTGKLNLVDLAGSENISKSGATDKRARETSMINTSLLTLGRVIVALTEHRGHIPYRESKLTRLLRDSLGGRTKTSLIATVSPASCNVEETLNTLDYASRAKYITNKPEMNQRLTKNALLKDYEDQIMKLQKDLQASRLGSGIYIDTHNYEEMIRELTLQKQEISEKINNIRALKEEMDERERICNELKMEVQQHIEIVETKTKQIEELENKLDQASSEISKLEVEKEEKEFLVAKHSTQEKILHVTAVKLLNTVKNSTQDNEKLHTKLDVIADLNKYNKCVYEQSISEFNSTVNQIQNRSSNFYSEQNIFHKSLLDVVTNIKTKQDEISILYGNLIGKYGEYKKSLDLQEVSLLYKQNELESKVNETKDLSAQVLNKKDELVDELLNQNFIPGFDEMLKSIQVQAEKTTEIIKSFQNVIEENSCHIHSSVEQLKNDLTDAKKQLFDRLENTNQLVSKVINHILSSVIDEKMIKDKTINDLNKIMNYTASVITQLTDRQARNEHVAAKTLTNLSSIASNLQNYEVDISYMVKNAIDTTECISDNLQYTNEDTVKVIEQYNKHKNDCHTNGFAIKQNTISSSTNLITTERQLDNKTKMDSNLTELIKMSTDSVQDVQNFISDLGSKVIDHSDMHDKVNNDSIDFYNKICKKVQSDVQSNNTHCSQYESHLNIELNDCRENFKKLFTTHIKEYKPTGYTPIRKKYKYPDNVPPATNPDEVVEDFRKIKFQIAEESDEVECDYENEPKENNENESENQDPNISDKKEDKNNSSKLEENEEVSKKRKILSDSISNSNIPLRYKVK